MWGVLPRSFDEQRIVVVRRYDGGNATSHISAMSRMLAPTGRSHHSCDSTTTANRGAYWCVLSLPNRSKRPVWIAAAVVVITGSAVLVACADDDQLVSTDTVSTTSPSVEPLSTGIAGVPTVAPTATFVGTWLSIDIDGSSQTMEIVRSSTGEYAVVMHDGVAAACAGAAAIITATGLLESDARLVIAQAS